MVGPKSKRWRERFKRSVLTSTHDDFSPVIERGQGINVMDVDGNRFIETSSQVGIASLGHNHPEIIKALKEYLEELRDDCLDVKIFGKSTTIIGSDCSRWQRNVARTCRTYPAGGPASRCARSRG